MWEQIRRAQQRQEVDRSAHAAPSKVRLNTTITGSGEEIVPVYFGRGFTEEPFFTFTSTKDYDPPGYPKIDGWLGDNVKPAAWSPDPVNTAVMFMTIHAAYYISGSQNSNLTVENQRGQHYTKLSKLGGARISNLNYRVDYNPTSTEQPRWTEDGRLAGYDNDPNTVYAKNISWAVEGIGGDPPVIRGNETYYTTTSQESSFRYTVPSNAQKGDLLLAAGHFVASNGYAITTRDPSWTVISKYGSAYLHIWLVGKIADGTEAGNTYYIDVSGSHHYSSSSVAIGNHSHTALTGTGGINHTNNSNMGSITISGYNLTQDPPDIEYTAAPVRNNLLMDGNFEHQGMVHAITQQNDEIPFTAEQGYSSLPQSYYINTGSDYPSYVDISRYQKGWWPYADKFFNDRTLSHGEEGSVFNLWRYGYLTETNFWVQTGDFPEGRFEQSLFDYAPAQGNPFFNFSNEFRDGTFIDGPTWRWDSSVAETYPGGANTYSALLEFDYATWYQWDGFFNAAIVPLSDGGMTWRLHFKSFGGSNPTNFIDANFQQGWSFGYVSIYPTNHGNWEYYDFVIPEDWWDPGNWTYSDPPWPDWLFENNHELFEDEFGMQNSLESLELYNSGTGDNEFLIGGWEIIQNNLVNPVTGSVWSLEKYGNSWCADTTIDDSGSSRWMTHWSDEPGDWNDTWPGTYNGGVRNAWRNIYAYALDHREQYAQPNFYGYQFEFEIDSVSGCEIELMAELGKWSFDVGREGYDRQTLTKDVAPGKQTVSLIYKPEREAAGVSTSGKALCWQFRVNGTEGQNVKVVRVGLQYAISEYEDDYTTCGIESWIRDEKGIYIGANVFVKKGSTTTTTSWPTVNGLPTI